MRVLLSLVVVADLDVVRTVRPPDETETPLVVDPNAVLSIPVASQALQAVPRRAPQVIQGVRRVQEKKLPVRLALDVCCQPQGSLSFEDPLRQGVPKAADHRERLW
jgi:hypothetical protein